LVENSGPGYSLYELDDVPETALQPHNTQSLSILLSPVPSIQYSNDSRLLGATLPPDVCTSTWTGPFCPDVYTVVAEQRSTVGDQPRDSSADARVTSGSSTTTRTSTIVFTVARR
jgi:hypothetical protein